MPKTVENSGSADKLQMLVYELDVESAMTKDIVTVDPESSVESLREVLRSNRISGVPVTEAGRLIGIVSIEDYIKWLADDNQPRTIRDVMSSQIESVYCDEPLVHVVTRLDSLGYGRLPVIDRSTGDLRGIVTKGDVIESLLHNLKIDFHDEEIRNYRTGRLFEDIMADTHRITFEYDIVGASVADGGAVASSLKKTLKRLGIHPSVVRRAAIAMYEAEMNVIIYANGGSVRVAVDAEHIQLVIEDHGPGIEDVERALSPGYSTAAEWVRELGFGAGMGLPNIKNSSESLEIDSVVGHGTTLKALFHMERECA